MNDTVMAARRGSSQNDPAGRRGQGGPGPFVENLSREECVELLAKGVVGRVVFTVDAMPAVTPVNYAVVDGTVVFRTDARSRLARAADAGVLAMEADQIDAATRSGWSVVATGVAEVAEDTDQIRAITRLVQPWVPGPAEVAVRLPMTVLTGRRVTDAS